MGWLPFSTGKKAYDGKVNLMNIAADSKPASQHACKINYFYFTYEKYTRILGK
jgi:hypothetical protein